MPSNLFSGYWFLFKMVPQFSSYNGRFSLITYRLTQTLEVDSLHGDTSFFILKKIIVPIVLLTATDRHETTKNIEE